MYFISYTEDEYREELQDYARAITVRMMEEDVRAPFGVKPVHYMTQEFVPSNSYWPFICRFRYEGVPYQYIDVISITYTQAKFLVYCSKSPRSKKYLDRIESRYKNSVQNLVLVENNPLTNAGAVQELVDEICGTPEFRRYATSDEVRELMATAISGLLGEDRRFSRYPDDILRRNKVLPALLGFHESVVNPHGGHRHYNIRPFLFEYKEALNQVYREKNHGHNGNNQVVAVR